MNNMIYNPWLEALNLVYYDPFSDVILQYTPHGISDYLGALAASVLRNDGQYDLISPMLDEVVVTPQGNYTKNTIKYSKLNQTTYLHTRPAGLGEVLSDMVIPKDFSFDDLYLQPKSYQVKAGDSLWKIAHDYNTTIENLKDLNPNIKGNMIHPGDQIIYDNNNNKNIYDLRAQWDNEKNWNKDNLTAIMNSNHQGNYVVVDKDKHCLVIYNKNNLELFRTYNIATGESGDDYNTITKADLSEKMNMSTPAGISYITGTGKYHGAMSFQRNRNYSTKPEDAIASSIHIGNTVNPKSSNGCIRVGNANVLNRMGLYIGQGTPVYTLPSRPGSRFSVHDGLLNFTADNPYGNDDPKNKKRFWDDYNVHTDKEYRPLLIEANSNLPQNMRESANEYAKSLVDNKRRLMSDLDMSSDTYNRLASLALGIAVLESLMGQSKGYKVKSHLPNSIVALLGLARDIVKHPLKAGTIIKNRVLAGNSHGYTQMKINGDGEDVLSIYKRYGITDKSLDNPSDAAVATMIRLWHMYTLQGTLFTGLNGKPVSREDAVMYRWMGFDNELRNHTATPDRNKYIRAVRKYSKMFNMYSVR